jgi:uncharacterized membrane protein YciS (DUF1049 family)
MKTLKISILSVLLLVTVAVNAQTDKATTAKVIAAQNYVFVANTAFPLNASDINQIMNKMPGYSGGGSVNLNGSNYDLSVTKDSLVAYLPYFGRSYTPKIGNPNDSGIKFKSKDFDYKTTARKKGGWMINMNPKDVGNNYRITLLVTETGYGTLTVNSNNEQTITFNGYIAETKPKKVK